MDDETELLVELALIEAKLALHRATRQRLCARLTSGGDIPRHELRTLKQRIADTEATIVTDRRRRTALLARVDGAEPDTNDRRADSAAVAGVAA